MKKFLVVFITVLLVGLIGASSASAALPGKGWWSALFVQNISESPGEITVDAYEKDAGGLVYSTGSEPFAFDMGTALVYDPGKTADYGSGGPYIGFEDPLPTGFEGSVVVSSSVPVAAVSEVANYQNNSVGGAGTASARYQGISQDALANYLMVPTIKHNYVDHTTTLYVQAAGEDAEVTATFNMNNGQSYSQTTTIEANRMFVFDPAAAENGLGEPVPSSGCGYNANTSPCYGSAVITSTTGPIAGTVIEHPHKGTPAGFAVSTRIQSEADQDTILYHPTIKNEYFRKMTAGASVQNVGTEPALVRISLTVTGVDARKNAKVGDTFEDIIVIPPGEARLFSKGRDTLGGMPVGTFAAAIIESVAEEYEGTSYTAQPLVGATNDSKVSDVPGGLGITLYAGFADKSKTNAIAAPIVRERNGNITGGFTIQNVGANPTKVTFTYFEYGSDNVYVFETTNDLQVGQAINPNQISKESDGGKFTIVSGFTSFSELNKKQFSVIATATEPIIGIASEYHIYDMRDMCNYEGTNLIID